MKKIVSTVLCLLFFLGLFSCATMQTQHEKGTAVGAGVGAILGQAIGRNTQATLLGAGIGAAIGGVAGNQIGRYMDLQEQELRAIEAASIRREQDVLRATFKGETFFDVNSTALKPGGYTELERVAQVLNKYPQTTIEIAGHTDMRGTAEYNQNLSLKRADSVRETLIQNGVAPERMETVGYGESRPISSDHAMNRRVEIIIVPIR